MSQVLAKDAITRVFSSVLKRAISDDELIARLSSLDLESNTTDFVLDLVDELLASEEFAMLNGPNSDFYKVTDQDIFYAFKFFLGRTPETPQVYEDKRKTSCSNALIEEIVASEEFKHNTILKNLISIRRKPKGIENIGKTPLARSHQNILVLSGCQGRMIADLIQSMAGLSYVENIYLSNANYNSFISTNGQTHASLLEWADLIFTQKKGVYDILKERPETQHKVRLIPLIEYVGLQPDQCYLTDIRSGSLIVGPLGEYHSTILTAAYFAQLDVDAAIELFNSQTYKAFGFQSLALESKQKLISQEADTGFPLTQMFDKWGKSGKWMRTVNHPKKHVLQDLVEFALRAEKLPLISDSAEFVIDDLAANIDWPEYGGTLAPPLVHTDLELNFKLPKAFTPDANSAVFASLRQYAELFYQTLQEYSLDDVFCHQLGRPVDIENYINYLKQGFTDA